MDVVDVERSDMVGKLVPSKFPLACSHRCSHSAGFLFSQLAIIPVEFLSCSWFNTLDFSKKFSNSLSLNLPVSRFVVEKNFLSPSTVEIDTGNALN